MRSLRIILVGMALSQWASASGEFGIEQDAGRFVLCHLPECAKPTPKVLDVTVQPVARKPPVIVPVEQSTTVHFRLGSDRLTKSALVRIGELARSWKAEGGSFEVLASTDKLGGHAVNRLLADRRARAVKRALMDAGVPATSISSSARCCIEHPPTTNPNARRAVVRLVQMKEQAHGE